MSEFNAEAYFADLHEDSMNLGGGEALADIGDLHAKFPDSTAYNISTSLFEALCNATNSVEAPDVDQAQPTTELGGFLRDLICANPEIVDDEFDFCRKAEPRFMYAAHKSTSTNFSDVYGVSRKAAILDENGQAVVFQKHKGEQTAIVLREHDTIGVPVGSIGELQIPVEALSRGDRVWTGSVTDVEAFKFARISTFMVPKELQFYPAYDTKKLGAVLASLAANVRGIDYIRKRVDKLVA